jgi:hypothetical protein
MIDITDLRAQIAAFTGRHRLDWFNDIGGCETCGPVYEVNCSCGWSGTFYNDHIEDMIEGWLGTEGTVFNDAR